MAASIEGEGSRKGLLEDNEDEDELFEIDLEVVDNIPPPRYYWEGYSTATGNALLANCLLPIADVSSAIPMKSNSWGEPAVEVKNVSNIVLIIEPVPVKSIWQDLHLKKYRFLDRTHEWTLS